MDMKINQKMIKDRCGIVSFNRGEAFYRAKKVQLEHISSDYCRATVEGKEDFQVILYKDGKDLKAECSCPSLASFQRDCQHIAAVLVALNDYRRKGNQSAMDEDQKDSLQNHELTANLVELFNSEKRSSSYRKHFENRHPLKVEFLCKPYRKDGGHIIGIELRVNGINVQSIREFLYNVKDNNSFLLTKTFTYDPSLHCFSMEEDKVILRLIEICKDERVYAQSPRIQQEDYATILPIPPSSWKYMKELLKQISSVKLYYDGQAFSGFEISKETLPLHFRFSEQAGNDYQLTVQGFERLVVLESYHSVLYNGKLMEMSAEDCEKLVYIKKMLEVSETNEIPIPSEQISFFMEKIIPALRRIGHVHLSEMIMNNINKTPLVAKLYLDRLKNRLLAGLEFHYENIVINPLEQTENRLNSFLIRDVEKENTIIEFMKESEFTETDGGYFMHNEELEYHFLQHIVPQLQKHVQIYATTSVRNRIFRGNARPRIRVKAPQERINWLEFTFEMEGFVEKEIREILIALEEKRKYYRLKNGSLFSLETRELEEINRFLYGIPAEKGDLVSGIQLPMIQGIQALSSIDDQKMLELEKSFRDFLENIYNPNFNSFTVPVQVESILRNYQVHGFQWMKTLAAYGFGGILADDMGLGKTLQSITFILSELPIIRKEKLPVLIVCPSSLTYNWLSEMMKFAPEIQAVVMDGNKKDRQNIQKSVIEVDVIITSYPLLRSDVHWYENTAFHTIFFDEAQAFKNPVTQTAKAVKKLQANYRFALTGTPIENSLEELWSIFHVVFPDLFHGIKEYSNLTRKTIARRIRPFLLRRMKEDVLDELPEKTQELASSEMLPDQKKLYAAYLAKLRHDTLKHLDKDTIRKNKIKILAGITRLRQICCHPALFVDGYKGKSAKFEQLLQIIEESKDAGRRLLIFSQFTKMLSLIGRELANRGLPFYYLDGQTPSEKRVEICNQFNAGGRDLFLISLKAGGTGLNLTGADTVILYDTWWNPAVEEQAADRAHRIGQQNAVQVIKLIARGTIEEKINELQEKKKHLIEEIISPDEKVSSGLTEEDIREILMI
ncbi:DEAD/DEAH box helicase [Bacillus sp. FJAT-49736]|uniref:DEAD/DEAH box helicase n=1 Tax=Bacillus sp. FJAT-49736 TaxID=2833582 RepID=UPI001BC9A1FA|nr:DEAD/DEAH box helicase [Bacillus sp. FJAT-49736]MBS4172759.1 SNF2 helicase associated domain-containing protein [Bacillus sp. FJAT-49736]